MFNLMFVTATFWVTKALTLQTKVEGGVLAYQIGTYTPSHFLNVWDILQQFCISAKTKQTLKIFFAADLQNAN